MLVRIRGWGGPAFAGQAARVRFVRAVLGAAKEAGGSLVVDVAPAAGERRSLLAGGGDKGGVKRLLGREEAENLEAALREARVRGADVIVVQTARPTQ